MGERWRGQHTVQSDHCDFKKTLRLSTLLEWMQRAGDAHLAENGILLDDMIEKGMAWMLVTIDLELDRLPRYGETMEILSWHKGSKGVQWFRDFRLYGEDQEQIGQCRTVWVLVDIHKRRILRSTAFPYTLPEMRSDSVGDAPGKVEIPADAVFEYNYRMTVRQSSLDMNGHMNNARFADICLDALTPEQLEADIARFHITYHQEALLGQEICVSRTAVAEDACYITGSTSEGIRSFDACLTFRRKK